MLNYKTETWQITIFLPVIAVEVFMEKFDSANDAVSCFEDKVNRRWVLNIHTQIHPETNLLSQTIKQLASSLDIPTPHYDITSVEQANWIEQSQKNIKPVITDQFYIHTDWHPIEINAEGKKHILINPQRAFGTGGHATTKGCIEALSDLHNKRAFSNIIDMGCGSGILSIAAAKLWPESQIIAADIDPTSVEITEENCIRNNTATQTTIIQSDGYSNPLISSSAPFDLIVSNMLANPLIAFANTTKKLVSSSSILIFSGILDTQEKLVTKAYLKEGFSLTKAYKDAEWCTLIFSS